MIYYIYIIMCTICVLHVFLILISANVGYTLQFLPVQQLPQKNQSVADFSQTQMFDRM